MKTNKLLIILLLIPMVSFADRVCPITIDKYPINAYQVIEDCHINKGDILMIRADISENKQERTEAVVTQNFYCDFSKAISVVTWDKPPTIIISCAYRGKK